MRSPALDVRALAGLRQPTRDAAAVASRIQAHLEANEGYVAFSGGKDSTVVVHQALAVDRDVPVVFFDSGWEYPETYRHIHHLANAWSLNLHVVPAAADTVAVLAATGAWDHHAARRECGARSAPGAHRRAGAPGPTPPTGPGSCGGCARRSRAGAPRRTPAPWPAPAAPARPPAIRARRGQRTAG